MSGLAFYYYLPIGLLLGLGAAFFWLALYKIITIGRAA
jgi:hypothetical protein